MIISLIKVLRCKKYVKSLLDGTLHCKTIQCFRDKGYDELEGAALVDPTTLRIGSHTVPKEDLVGPVVIQPNVVANLNVFCMFAWRAPKVGDANDVRRGLESQLGSIRDCIDDFGPYAVVVKNTTEFLHRVELAAHRRYNIGFHKRGLVEYIDPDSLRMNFTEVSRIPFFKQKKFAHQKEYRFVFQTNDKPGLLELPIGGHPRHRILHEDRGNLR